MDQAFVERMKQKLLDMEPKKPDPHFLMAKAHLALGLHGEARRSLKRAVDYDPKHSPAISMLGVVEDRLGHHRAAVQEQRADQPDHGDRLEAPGWPVAHGPSSAATSGTWVGSCRS